MTSPNADDTTAEETASRSAAPQGARSLTLLASLGTASALWAIFLWRELLAARAGEDPFCGFGESTDCGTLWSAAFASKIHDLTGLPVAGWGLAWGLVATVLPLIALARAQRGGAARAAIELTAAAGIAGIVVLLAASAAEGLFCTSCAVTYVLTIVYAVVTFGSLRQSGGERSAHSVTLAIATTLAAYLLLLYPGLKTPKSQAEEGQQALIDATQRAAGAADSTSAPTASETPAAGQAPGTAANPGFDQQLNELLASLPPQALQWLSDSLHLYREAEDRGSLPPRVLATGSPDATVKITEFTDILCGHCANLHTTVEYLANLLPPTSFSVDARHFPLDGNCNKRLQRRGAESVRCLAARAQICMEDTGRLFEFSGKLFKRQEGLTEADVFEVAGEFMQPAALEECLASKETKNKLREDVEYAWRHKPHGTPLVLVNGRQGTQFGPFLYAMILTGGNPDHPAFANLPTPDPPEHDHQH